ncbi:MAG: hypothetical protein ACRD0O_10480, partial [Acidimicrobiia bacterium]
ATPLSGAPGVSGVAPGISPDGGGGGPVPLLPLTVPGLIGPAPPPGRPGRRGRREIKDALKEMRAG